MTTLEYSNTRPHVGPANRFFTISNILSISRALLAIPFAIVMLGEAPGSRLWGAIIIAVATVTDKLDGVFARKYNQITDWGKLLDPLADKIAVGAVAVVLLVLGNCPLWFVAALLVRDALIFTGGVYVKKRKGILLQSNEAGKWTVGIVTIALFLMVLNVPSLYIDIALSASVALLIISFALYVKRFNEVLRG